MNCDPKSIYIKIHLHTEIEADKQTYYTYTIITHKILDPHMQVWNEYRFDSVTFRYIDCDYRLFCDH